MSRPTAKVTFIVSVPAAKEKRGTKEEKIFCGAHKNAHGQTHDHPVEPNISILRMARGDPILCQVGGRGGGGEYLLRGLHGASQLPGAWRRAGTQRSASDATRTVMDRLISRSLHPTTSIAARPPVHEIGRHPAKS